MGFNEVFHITDEDVEKYIKFNKLDIKIETKYDIKPRDVLRGGIC